MKTALVTGSDGFVGRHFVNHLADTDWDVTSIDIQVDALNFFKHVTTQFDLVVHAAAMAANRKGIDFHKNAFPYNVMLDSSMLNWAYRTAQQHVVYLSSCAVYPKVLTTHMMTKRLHEDFVGYDQFHLSNIFPLGVDPTPLDRYGWAKLIGEHMARAVNEAGGTFVTVVRPFSGYGTSQSPDFPFRAFIERVKAREDPFKIWGTGTQVRDWIHIDDIVRGTLALVEAKVTQPVNLCTGIATSMRSLAEQMFTAADWNGRYDPLIQTLSDEPNGADFRVGDPELLSKYYTPRVSLNEGISRALKGK